MNKFYITSPAYYINDQPHAGHSYTTITCDIIARHQKQKGKEVVFVTGTDENSQKTIDAARTAGKEIKLFADEMAGTWEKTWNELGIKYTDFVRTTEERHKKVVLDFTKRVLDRGDIYKGKYEGLYCSGCESFKSKDELTQEGLCPLHKRAPEKRSEQNYFFALSKYQDKLLDFYEKNFEFVEPKERFNEVISFVKQGLQDISITREGFEWGVPFPEDESQRIWVWFDALTFYITGLGDDFEKFWPPDLQIVGKDILRFHAVIWPAMLMSAGYDLPKKIFAHGFFTVDGQKMSKTLGNVIDPLEMIKKYGRDAFRYLIVSQFAFGQDGDMSIAKFDEGYNAELVNGIGNLIGRFQGLRKKLNVANLLTYEVNYLKHIEEIRKDYDARMESLDVFGATRIIKDFVSSCDKYIEENKAWQKEGKELEKIVSTLEASIKVLTELLLPFVPEKTEEIKASLEGKDLASLFPRLYT